MKPITCLPVFLLAACSTEQLPDAPTSMPATSAKETAMAKPCPVYESRNWTAWIDAEPPAKPSLHIRGEVDLPTPGYTSAWRMGIADRAMPPGVHFHLEFTAPDGMVAQVISTEEVAYEAQSVYPAYRVIYVHCGDKVLAEITDIPRAE